MRRSVRIGGGWVAGLGLLLAACATPEPASSDGPDAGASRAADAGLAGADASPSPGADASPDAATPHASPDAAAPDAATPDAATPAPDAAPDAALSIAGRIAAPANALADTDVNDPAAPYASNDAPAAAQRLPNPATVAGYANRAGAGAAGRSRVAGDALDVYRVTLAAGQSVQLFVAGDGADDDLDLCLYPVAGGEPLACSLSQTRREVLTAPSTGELLVAVVAFAGASNYTLTIGVGAAAATAEPPAVAGEIIVRPALRGPGLALNADLPRALGMRRAAGAPDREQRLRYGEVPDAQLARALDQPALAGALRLPRSPALIAKAAARRADVASASPNYLTAPSFAPDDTYYPLQWHYDAIELPAAWDLVPATSDVIVAVIDTGVVLGHPDLAGALVPGYDFVSSPGIAADGDGIDPDPSDPGDGQAPGLGSFHGTHVTGTVAASTDNGVGVAGVAFNAQVMPLRAMGVGGGTIYDLLQALRFAAGLPNDSGTVPARAADIVNMSLGGPGFTDALAAQLLELRELGIVLVAAAGNSATMLPSYPAAHEGVISVSATRPDDGLASYSNYGPAIDVAAPGGELLLGSGAGVLSTWASDAGGSIATGFGFAQGTSMAAPHVAGVVALMRSVNPELTPQDIDDMLALGLMTVERGGAGRDDLYGHGRLDARAAVEAALTYDGASPPESAPRLVLSTALLDFGTAAATLRFEAHNGGGGSLELQPPSADVAWLSVGAAAQIEDGWRFDVSVSRAGLAAGTYAATIAVGSSANDAAIAVLLQVGDVPGDLGLHYLVVTNAARSPIAVAPLVARDGGYDYAVGGLAPGRYFVFAGTDHDHDGVVCDAGEACGGYPTLAEPVVIELSATRRDVDFATSAGSATSPGLAATAR